MTTEPNRLAGNQRTLLEKMPQMVLLTSADGVIEYTNPNAVPFIKSCEEQLGKDLLKQHISEIITSLTGENGAKPQKTYLINKRPFECHLAPFSGYNGDYMHWLFLNSRRNYDDSVPRRLTANDAEEKQIVGSSKIMTDLKNMVARVSKTDTTVLVTGESGSGKELIANLICRKSKRHNKPFLTINCNTINDSLLESDLFGHEKGSFTGAHSLNKGKFEVVDGGTIFLDEIGDISPRMQSVLLRVLEEGEIVRVGGTTPIKTDVRIIAATNCDLVKAVQEGTFRLDLFYRLNIINIKIPPLRERKDDLIEFAVHFVKRYNKQFDRNIKFIPDNIISLLRAYEWPGNVRELENVIQRAVLMTDSEAITKDDLIFDMPLFENQASSLSSLIGSFEGEPLKGIVDQVEKEVIVHKLSENRGNVAHTADTLNISKAALYEKMKRHDISAKALR
jgi:transcriptional regulator with PAS, ATPase and Fis domain